jgi:hypothetical protein
MTVPVAFLEVPDAPGRIVQPGDISEGDGNSITVPLNRGGDIIEQGIAKRQFTFKVKGLSATEVTLLKSISETNLTNLLAGSTPAVKVIAFSGLTFSDCFLRSVKPSGSVRVGDDEIVDSTDLLYETLGRYLV